jgi:hypothetical protein
MLMQMNPFLRLRSPAGSTTSRILHRCSVAISERVRTPGVDVTGKARRVARCTLYVGERSGARAPGQVIVARFARYASAPA